MGLFAEGWNVAYRKKKTGTILEDTLSEFSVIKNTWRTWCADPFVFRYKEDVYIFAEIYDFFREKAGIGYIKYNNSTKKFSKWKTVIKEPFHMSYPFIFECHGNIYMVPETSESDSLILYRATSFPDEWVKEKTILSGRKLTDTTFHLTDDENIFALTYEIKDDEMWELELFEIVGDKIDFSSINPLSTDVSVARPGGKFFKYNNMLIRVSQDCKSSYGYGLNFFEIKKINLNEFEERKIFYLTPNEIKMDKNIKATGVHTYNSENNFEVIDIKSVKKSVIYIVARLINKIKRMLKK